jgi:hypothetical protein
MRSKRVIAEFATSDDLSRVQSATPADDRVSHGGHRPDSGDD